MVISTIINSLASFAPLFYFNLIVFIVVSCITFTIPGILFLNICKIKLSLLEKTVLGSSIGLVIVTLISYVLIVLKISFLFLPIIILLMIPAIKPLRESFKKISYPSSSRLAILLFVITAGVILQLLVIAPSGTFQNGNLVFWSAHGHDGMWHIALMDEMQKGKQLQNPVYAGERLVNYHFFSDIAPAEFNKIFKIPSLDLYFRYFPLFYSVLLGGLSFMLGKKIGGNFSTGIWSTIFTYFAGSFGYIVTYIQNKTIGGEAIFWATQISSSSGNPPLIVSFIIFLTFIYLLIIFQSIKNKPLMLLLVILGGSLIVFKVYGGILLLFGIGAVGAWEIIRYRSFSTLLIFIGSLVLSLILYFPNTSGTTSFLIWEPWWFVRTMVVADNKLNWLDFELRRQTYLSEHNLKRVMQLEFTAFMIFFVGNLGLRVIGFWEFGKSIRTILSNQLFQFIFVVCIFSLLLPLLFLQSGVAGNTIQFFQYFLLVMGILSGVTLAKFLNKFNNIGVTITISILAITIMIPTQIALLSDFYQRSPFAKVNKFEIQALNYIKNNTDPFSRILTPPYNPYLNLNQQTPDIWGWFDTAYVSALSSRRVFMADREQVDIMGYNAKNREYIQESVFKETNPQKFEQILKDNRIDYLYIPNKLQPIIDLTKTTLVSVYKNEEVAVWRVY